MEAGIDVQGRSLGGWIVADPTLTAAGTFNTYAEADGFTALYPQNWGFQQETFGTLFVPQQGTGQSIVLETAQQSQVVRGRRAARVYAIELSTGSSCAATPARSSYYMKNATSTGATPPPLPVARQPLYAEVRFRIDSTHAMLIGFNYQNSSQLDVFAALYNSLAFPFPLCEAPARNRRRRSLREHVVPVLWLTPGTVLLLTIAVLAIDIPAAAISRMPTYAAPSPRRRDAAACAGLGR